MKILAIANAHALAHVSRLLEVAKVLRQRGHEVLFAGHGKYLQVADWDDFPTRELPYISVEQVVQAVRSQRLWELYREPELETFIQAELELYDEHQPEVVLIDNRPTARTSAEIAGIKTAAVLNVHMSNYRRIPFFSLRNLVKRERFPGLDLMDRLENAIEGRVYDQLVMGGLNRLRRKRGLARLYAYDHEAGDVTFLADIPEFNPVSMLPPETRYIGPLTWRNQLPAPACLERLRADQPMVYLSLGSEGLEDLLGQLGTLTTSGIQIVVAAGAAELSPDLHLPEGVFVERYVNTDALLPRCDLVCCHGGNGTLYQAFSFGLPVVVVATHQEQYYGGKRVERLGLGRTLTLADVKRNGTARLLAVLREVLTTGSYREKAHDFSQYLRGWRGAELAADDVCRLATIT